MKNRVALLLLAMVVSPLVLPLLEEGMLVSDDGLAHLVRMQALADAFRSGVLLPRWAQDLNFGFGSPVFLYNWLLPYYIGGLAMLGGLGVVTAYKFTLALGVILSALFSYLWLKGNFGRLGGLVGSIIYTWVPYRIMTVYERGTPGEAWLSVFAPLILWLTSKENKDNWGRTLLPIAWAGMFLTHSVGGMILTPLILFLSYYPPSPIIARGTRAALIGLSMAAFNLLPAAFEAPITTNVGSFFLETAAYLHATVAKKELMSLHPFTVFTNGPRSLAVGWAIPIIVLLGILGRLGKLMGGVILAAFLLMSPWFSWVWHAPFLQTVLYPWRLVQVVILCAAFLAARLVGHKTNVTNMSHISFLILIAVMSSIPALTTKPRFETLPLNWYQTTPPDVIGEYLPKGITYEKLSKKLHPGGVIRYDHLYFPGWKAYAYGVELPIRSDFPGREGFITLEIPSTLPVTFKFTETPIRKLGIALSFAGMFCYFVYLVSPVRKYSLKGLFNRQ